MACCIVECMVKRQYTCAIYADQGTLIGTIVHITHPLLYISLMQVDSQWTNKDYAGAQKASLYTKRWSIAALIVGGVGVFTLLPAYVYTIAGFVFFFLRSVVETGGAYSVTNVTNVTVGASPPQ